MNILDSLYNIINEPLGYVLRFITNACNGNFAAAVFIFTLLINLAFIPLTIKSQKSSVQQMRIKPKLDALKEKCGDDKQKYSMEMQELYQKEGVSMGGGCLPMIFRMVIMLSIYYLIMSPVTYLSNVPKTKVEKVQTVVSDYIADLKESDKKADKAKYEELIDKLEWDTKNQNNRTNQLSIIKLIRSEDKLNTLKEMLPEKKYNEIAGHLEDMVAKDKKADVDFKLLGIDLTDTPVFSIDILGAFDKRWIMPLLAFAAQMLSSIMSMLQQKKQNPDAPNMMGMMLTMPLISLFIGFNFPCGVTFYWACSSLIGGVIQLFVQQYYGPHKLLSKERVKELAKQCDFETAQIKKFGAQD